MENFITILLWKSQCLGSFAWKDIVCTANVYLFKGEGWDFFKF